MPAGTIEQRKHPRYNLSLPVRVRAKGRSAPPIETSSNDISANGIYFTLSEGLELGSELELEIDLPQELTRGEKVRVRCRARIARVERMDSQGKIGVGAIIKRYRFTKAAPGSGKRS